MSARKHFLCKSQPRFFFFVALVQRAVTDTKHCNRGFWLYIYVFTLVRFHRWCCNGICSRNGGLLRWNNVTKERIPSAVLIHKLTVWFIIFPCQVNLPVTDLGFYRPQACVPKSRSCCCRVIIQYFSLFYLLLIAVVNLFNGIICSHHRLHVWLKHILLRMACWCQRQTKVHTFR